MCGLAETEDACGWSASARWSGVCRDFTCLRDGRICAKTLVLRKYMWLSGGNSGIEGTVRLFGWWEMLVKSHVWVRVCLCGEDK